MRYERDIRTRMDENGDEWLTDEDGKYVKDEFGDKIPPTQTSKKDTSSGFTTYDSSEGHCTFCGKLSCRGTCFK